MLKEVWKKTGERWMKTKPKDNRLVFVNTVINRRGNSMNGWAVNREKGYEEYKPFMNRYIEQLNNSLNNLEELYRNCASIFKLDEVHYGDVRELYKREIRYAQFSLYLEEQMSKKGFNKWHYSKKNAMHYRSNGKVRAEIHIANTVLKKRITLMVMNEFRNDDSLLFITPQQVRDPVIVERKDSVEKAVNQFKEEADRIIEEHQYPVDCWERQNLQQLKQMLRIRDTPEEKKQDLLRDVLIKLKEGK